MNWLFIMLLYYNGAPIAEVHIRTENEKTCLLFESNSKWAMKFTPLTATVTRSCTREVPA